MVPIAPISLPRAVEPISLSANAAPAGGFQQILSSALSHVAQSSAAADTGVANYLQGGSSQELHSTILATQIASLDFDLLLQVRNKVASAYDEIMKMQI
jgi:flagellar hook-basal body complex protein FliE